jgi:hypothetical protein
MSMSMSFRRAFSFAAGVPRVRPALARSPMIYPMTNLHSPNSMQIVKGHGCRVTDEHGREHLEGMAGARSWPRPDPSRARSALSCTRIPRGAASMRRC